MRVIEPDRDRAKETVEIDQPLARDGVINVRTATAFEIEDNLEAIHQDVAFELFQRVGGGAGRTLGAGQGVGGTALRWGAGRLRDSGRHTHALRLAGPSEAVNRSGPPPELSARQR